MSPNKRSGAIGRKRTNEAKMIKRGGRDRRMPLGPCEPGIEDRMNGIKAPAAKVQAT